MSKVCILSRRHLFDYSRVSTGVVCMERSPDSRLACDQTESCKDVSSKNCNFVFGRLICRTEANHANPSFLGVCRFLNEERVLQMHEPSVWITYLDDENIQCILNQGSMASVLTDNKDESMHFRVHLPADVQDANRTFSAFSKFDRQFNYNCSE